jgi:hypothetical protein
VDIKEREMAGRKYTNKPGFDPEGGKYDHDSAIKAGMTRGEDGHYGSVVEQPDGSYLMLKGRRHPTYHKAVDAEKKRGYRIEKRGKRYYSVKD